MDGHQRGNAHAVDKHFTHAMSWRLRSDHAHVDVGRRFDKSKMDREAVREHQCFAGRQMRLQILFVQIRLNVVRYQEHHDVGGFRSMRIIHDAQPGGLGLSAALTGFRQPDHDADARIAKIQRVRVLQASIAENPDGLTFRLGNVAVLLVVTS